MVWICTADECKIGTQVINKLSFSSKSLHPFSFCCSSMGDEGIRVTSYLQPKQSLSALRKLWPDLIMSSSSKHADSKRQACLDVLWTHAVRVLSLLTSPVQHSALKWSNSIVVLATLALAGLQSAVALGPSMPRSQKQSRPPDKRGFQLSLPQLLSSLTHSLCVRLCPLPVSGLDEVLVGSGASVNLHYYEFIHAHMSPPSFFSFPKSPTPFFPLFFPKLVHPSFASFFL